PAPASCDPRDAVRLHQPRHDASADLDALALEFSGDALRPVGWMRCVDLQPIAQAVDERETFTRGSVLDQRLRGLARKLVLEAQTLDLAPLTVDLVAHVRDD